MRSLVIGKQLKATVASSVLRLPAVAARRFLGKHSVVVDGKTLDTKTQFLLRLVVLAGDPSPETLSPPAAREQLAESSSMASGKLRYMAQVADLRVRSGEVEIPVRVYCPRIGGERLPVLVYYHGGGWVLGSVETHDVLCRDLAAQADCIVVSVDYRLAPEHPFPAAVDDALAAYRWVVEHCRDFRGDSSRVAVGGDSAGGNLAAVVSRELALDGGPIPWFQLLIYPVTDLACSSDSYDKFGNGFFLTREMMHWFRDHYLNGEGAIDDPRVSPLKAILPSSLPPTFVMTAGFDPLLDEGLAYAQRLRAAGVDVAYRCHPSLIHGFVSMTGAVPAAREAVSEAATALRLAFAKL
jgi:acetyl esterase